MKDRTIFILLLITIAGCAGDAPHDNPLDPLAPGFTPSGALTGRIIVRNKETGIAGALVAHLGSDEFSMTDALGYFSFTHLAEGTRRFVCTKENFSADTFQVEILPAQAVHVVREVNGAPVAVSRTILTRKIDQYFPSPQYFIDVAAEVADPNTNEEIVSVRFAFDTLSFPMSYSVESKKFTATILKYDIPTATISYLIGRPLYIVCRDTNNAVSTSAPFYVSQIIEQTAAPIVSNTDSLNTGFTLRWSPPEITFNCTYSVTISMVNGGVQSVWRNYDGISAVEEALTYPYAAGDTPLQPGSYVWSVKIVDGFGNYSRSKESSFTVKEGLQ